MSSIYKKGRDGYYYYQTYTYNDKTKKKDKRIFHALNTKDLNEAREKQIQLDLKYLETLKIKSSFRKKNSLFSTILITISITLLSILIIELRKPNLSSVKFDDYGQLKSEIIIEESMEEQGQKEDTDIIENIENKVLSINDKAELRSFSEQTNIIEKKIPNFNIERIERLSGAFNQGKIFVTVEKNSDNESQRLLCENLAEKYSEFSNIVICLYADDFNGKQLASGNSKLVSIENQKKSWLSMYTFNSVEGAYFDNNPSGYLGPN